MSKSSYSGSRGRFKDPSVSRDYVDHLYDMDRWRYDNLPKVPREQGARPKTYSSPPHKPDRRSGYGGPAPKTIDLERKKDGSWKVPHPSKAALKRAIDVARRANQINKMLDLIDLLGKEQPVLPGAYDIQIPGMRMCDGPYGPLPGDVANQLVFSPNDLHCDPWQLTGQAFGAGHRWMMGRGELAPGAVFDRDGDGHGNPVTIPASAMLGWPRGDYSRWNEQSTHVRIAGTTVEFVELRVFPQMQVGLQMATNPNLERYAPPSDAVIPQAVYSDATNPFRAPILAETPALQRAVHSTPSSSAHAMTASATGSGAASPPNRPQVVSPAGRRPPGRGEKEKKILSRSAKIGVMIFKILDQLSEGADVVDAVFEALPEDVRKRWKCNARRGPIDNFGQYGISNADCKLQALWHNWHRLDGREAVLNILKNELEDKIYGGIHKHLPKQAGGPSLDQAWEAFGRTMKSAGF